MIATLRDGTTLEVGDTVTTNYKGCKGYEFTICEINPYATCESGFMVVVHLKGDPTRVIKSPFAGKDGRPSGIDSNWFVKSTPPTAESIGTVENGDAG